LTAHAAPGTFTIPPAGPPHVHRRLALDSLHHHRCARPGRAQCDAAVADRAARHLGRDQYPLPVRLSVLDLFFAVVLARDRRPGAVADAAFWPWLLLGALSQIVATG
jgi:hypothetical protein